MDWPSSAPVSANGPTSLAGPGATVPDTPTEIGGGTAKLLLGIHCTNENTTTDRTVTVTNSAGDLVWKETIPPKSGSKPYSPTFEPVLGVKWSVDDGGAGDVKGHVWVY